MRQPITPVDEGNTSLEDDSPSALAVEEHTSSAASTPPGAQTFETLLLITTACSFPSFSAILDRPTITGAPGNAFFVKSAANESVGLSIDIRVTVIFACIVGTSCGLNPSLCAPTRNPLGSFVGNDFMYDSSLVNVAIDFLDP
jgi:hypothetical protein